MAVGTYHGPTREYLQSYMDEYSWRYAHRHDRNISFSLIGDMCSHTCTRMELLELFAPQPTIEKVA